MGLSAASQRSAHAGGPTTIAAGASCAHDGHSRGGRGNYTENCKLLQSDACTMTPDGTPNNLKAVRTIIISSHQEFVFAEAICKEGPAVTHRFGTKRSKPLLFPAFLCKGNDGRYLCCAVLTPMAKLHVIEKAGPGASTVALAGFIVKVWLMGDDSLYVPYSETLPRGRFIDL